MRISSKLRYGLFLMGELSLQYENDSLVQIKNFAQQKGISYKYLEQIVIALKNEGLIESVRGPHGGYKLSKSPASITLYEILVSVQGDLNPARCNHTEEKTCNNASQCLTIGLWSILEVTIREKLSNTTLKEFVDSVPNFWETKCSMKEVLA